MSDPALSLQIAILGILKADAAVDALVADRIFDRVPPDAVVPYISFGPRQAISDDALCLDGYEVFVQIDAWSRIVGQTEAQSIAGAVREALRDIEVVLIGFNLHEKRQLNTS